MKMIEPGCENVCLAIMASLDGREVELTPEIIDRHLATCARCREEAEQLKALNQLLDAHERREPAVDIWPMVRAGITAQRSQDTTSSKSLPFMVLSLLLLGYMLLELIPRVDLGMLFKVVPVLIVIAVFVYVKENPLKINVQLRLEGE